MADVEQEKIADAIEDAAETAGEIAASVIVDNAAAIAAEVVEEKNERAEQAEAVAEALIDVQMHSIEREDRERSERALWDAIEKAHERIAECEAKLNELSTKAETPAMVIVEQAPEMSSTPPLSSQSSEDAGVPESMMQEVVEAAEAQASASQPASESQPRARRRVRLL